MKHYLRFLWIAVFCGFFCIFGYMKNSTECLFSDIILYLGFYEVDYYPQYIPAITYWYMPLMLYQIFFGTYIYRHFCSASIYFFSRNCSRTKWFIKESGKLYLFGTAYLILMIISGTLITSIFVPVIYDSLAFPILIYYILIYSVFLFVSAISINILAILFGSNTGFIIVESIYIFGMAVFVLMGIYFFPDEAPVNEGAWLLKINPFAHLVFPMHSSRFSDIDSKINLRNIDFDLNESLAVYLAAAVIFISLGCVIVNRHNFISTNQGEGEY